METFGEKSDTKYDLCIVNLPYGGSNLFIIRRYSIAQIYLRISTYGLGKQLSAWELTKNKKKSLGFLEFSKLSRFQKCLKF